VSARMNRFHGGREIRNIFRQGRIFRSDNFDVRLVESGKSRLAVVVSKKIHKHAVVRNRIRRRVSEIIRELRSQYSMTQDMVFVAKTNSLVDENHETLKQTITTALMYNKQ